MDFLTATAVSATDLSPRIDLETLALPAGKIALCESGETDHRQGRGPGRPVGGHGGARVEKGAGAELTSGRALVGNCGGLCNVA